MGICAPWELIRWNDSCSRAAPTSISRRALALTQQTQHASRFTACFVCVHVPPARLPPFLSFSVSLSFFPSASAPPLIQVPQLLPLHHLQLPEPLSPSLPLSLGLSLSLSPSLPDSPSESDTEYKARGRLLPAPHTPSPLLFLTGSSEKPSSVRLPPHL